MGRQGQTLVEKAPPSLIVLGLMLATLLATDVAAVAQERTPENPSPEPPGPPSSVEQTDLVAQLTIECAENAGYVAGYELVTTGVESRTAVPLTDEDGDGVLTGTQTFPRFPPGPQPPGTKPITVPDVRIVAPDGSTVEQFGPVTLNRGEMTFPSTVYFCDGDVPGGGSTSGGFVGERIVGTDGPDDLRGTPGDDALRGGDGNDILQGFDRADLLVAGAGADEVYGGAGNDALYAAYDVPASEAPNAPASHDLIYGGEGDDFIDSADAAGAFDAVYCGPGDDLVEADAEDFVADDCKEVVRF